MEGRLCRGTVKTFKGSFGWLSCSEVAEQYGGRDVFLHKNVLNAVPAIGSTVAFRLVLDAKGQPKAEDAMVEAAGPEPASGAIAASTSALVQAQRGKAQAVDETGEAAQMQIKRAALMLFRGDEVLVVREKKDGGEKLLWSDLGGKVEAKEGLLDCALRELAEEAQ
ncbi:unnamed protein product, partial [Polarella glacialis]